MKPGSLQLVNDFLLTLLVSLFQEKLTQELESGRLSAPVEAKRGGARAIFQGTLPLYYMGQVIELERHSLPKTDVEFSDHFEDEAVTYYGYAAP